MSEIGAEIGAFPCKQRPAKDKQVAQNDGLNWEGIEFPTNIAQIRNLEKQNEGLPINVWGWENGDLIILHISHKSKAVKRINLMLLMDGEKPHYCWIKNFSRLIFGKTKHDHEQFYCELCLSRFKL